MRLCAETMLLVLLLLAACSNEAVCPAGSVKSGGACQVVDVSGDWSFELPSHADVGADVGIEATVDAADAQQDLAGSDVLDAKPETAGDLKDTNE